MPAPSQFRAKTLRRIDRMRRDQGLDYHTLADKTGLNRYQVIRALVGSPEMTNFPTLVALAKAVGLDLAQAALEPPLAAASA